MRVKGGNGKKEKRVGNRSAEKTDLRSRIFPGSKAERRSGVDGNGGRVKTTTPRSEGAAVSKKKTKINNSEGDRTEEHQAQGENLRRPTRKVTDIGDFATQMNLI